MSFALTLSSLSDKERRRILRKFTVQPKATQYNPDPPKYRCFQADAEDDSLKLPLGAWKKYLDPREGFPNGEAEDFDSMNPKAKFKGKLLTAETDPMGRGRNQKDVVEQALSRLELEGSVFIACYTGFGKSATAVYLSLALGLKTMIICHLDIVRRQWPGEYDKFSGGNVKTQFLRGKCTLDPDADVYIVGIQKAANMSSDDFLTIGTVIIDEAHISTVTAFTKTLLKFQPRYLIGLSATPDRADGLHSLLSNYFGDENDFIVRREVKEFTVYKLQTPFKPEISYTTVRGRSVPDWNKIVNSIEENPKRQGLIADLACEHPDEKIIILCNRNSLSIGVYDILKERGESVELLIQSKKTYDQTARILVAGFKKGGVGLNDPKLTMAIIASDTQDVRQYEGRIRTTNNIIYHLVDYYKPFQNHWEVCEKWYSEKGAEIKILGTKHTFGQKKNSTQETSGRRRFLKR